MKNDLQAWRKLACRKVPMIAALLHAFTYIEESNADWWKSMSGGLTGDGTFCVNPNTLECRYSPQFAAKNTVEQNAFVLAHEGVHVLCNHLERRASMAKKEGSNFIALAWLLAEEEAVNELVKTVGDWKETPASLVLGPQNRTNMTTEARYFDIKKSVKIIKVPSTCMCGQGDAKSQEAKDLQGVVDILKSQAMESGRRMAREHCKGQQPGNMPGELCELAVEMPALSNPPSFRDLLMRYMTSMTADCRHFDDATIYRNRLLTDGLCVPNLANRPQASRFVISLDNSGSVSDELFGTFKATMIEAAQQLGFDEIIVQHFTTQVMKTERYTDLNKLKKMNRAADGGTDMTHADLLAGKSRGLFHIVLTDGYITWLDRYSIPTVIVRLKNEVQPPPKVRNLVADVMLQ